MAKFTSVIIRSGSGRVGNVYMRYSRGQSVICAMPSGGASSTPMQVKQRNGFGEASKIAKSLQVMIEAGFDRTDGRSKRNNFTHYNKSIVRYAKEGSLYNYEVPPITNLCLALNDPEFDGKIYAAKGSYDLNSRFGWDADDEVEATLLFRRDFAVGDMIYLFLCYSYMEMGDPYEMMNIFEKELTAADIEALPSRNKFLLNKQTMPDLDTAKDLPENIEGLEILATVIVEGDMGRSTSLIYPMPDMPYMFTVASQTTVGEKTMKLVDSNPEAFAEEFDGKLEGSVLRQWEDGYEGYSELPFAGYAMDGDGKINGVLIGAKDVFEFLDPFQGEPTSKSLLVKDEEVLINFIGAKVPIWGG